MPPQASLAARGREEGREALKGEGEEEEGLKNGVDDGEAPPISPPAPAPPPPAPPPNDEDSGTGLGALLMTTEKSPQGSPQVQTPPSSVRAAE